MRQSGSRGLVSVASVGVRFDRAGWLICVVRRAVSADAVHRIPALLRAHETAAVGSVTHVVDRAPWIVLSHRAALDRCAEGKYSERKQHEPHRRLPAVVAQTKLTRSVVAGIDSCQRCRFRTIRLKLA